MILTVAGFKGGTGKSTTAVHLAACLQARASTALVDGDENRSVTAWAQRGRLPFPVVDERAAAKAARQYEHLVIDTAAHPSKDDLRALVESCDLLVIPTTPDALALDALTLTMATLRVLGASLYRVLLTIIPPRPSRDGDEARAMLELQQVPLFAAGIRRLVAFQKAALAGVLVNEVNDPRAAWGWEDYQAVANEILK